jgi:hypothetical protein
MRLPDVIPTDVVKDPTPMTEETKAFRTEARLLASHSDKAQLISWCCLGAVWLVAMAATVAIALLQKLSDGSEGAHWCIFGAFIVGWFLDAFCVCVSHLVRSVEWALYTRQNDIYAAYPNDVLVVWAYRIRQLCYRELDMIKTLLAGFSLILEVLFIVALVYAWKGHLLHTLQIVTLSVISLALALFKYREREGK